MESLQLISYFVTGIAIIGTVANSFQKRWCFIVWIITNAFWIGYNAYMGSYAQMILYIVNTVTSIIGWIKWGKKSKQEEKKENV